MQLIKHTALATLLTLPFFAAGVSCSSSNDSGSSSGSAQSGGSSGEGGSTNTAGSAGSSATGGAGGSTSAPEVPAGLKVAFFGDQGLTASSRAVLDLIVEEEADFVIHLGDFDYEDDPPAWEKMMDDHLGEMPWFAVIGNHDIDAWPGYREVIERKLERMAEQTQCEGEPGVQQSCMFKGVRMLIVGMGLKWPESGMPYDQYLSEELSTETSPWRFCVWHKNQRDMQLGDKGNEVGWGVFSACQSYGGIILNGHEHSYGRTYTMTDFGNLLSGGTDHGKTGVWNMTEVALGRTFFVINGAGGKSLRTYLAEEHDDDTWWATGYTATMNIIEGGTRVEPTLEQQMDDAVAAFMTFGVDGDPYKAEGYAKTIGGKVIDEWTVTVDPTGFGSGPSQ